MKATSNLTHPGSGQGLVVAALQSLQCNASNALQRRAGGLVVTLQHCNHRHGSTAGNSGSCGAAARSRVTQEETLMVAPEALCNESAQPPGQDQSSQKQPRPPLRAYLANSCRCDPGGVNTMNLTPPIRPFEPCQNMRRRGFCRAVASTARQEPRPPGPMLAQALSSRSTDPERGQKASSRGGLTTLHRNLHSNFSALLPPVILHWQSTNG
jgi:hypothetical protein